MRSACWLALAVACGPAPLEDGFEAEFTTLSGCADIVFYAVNADDTVLLSLRADDLIADAGPAQQTYDYTLPDAEVDLKVEVGTRISDAICDDLIENGGPQVKQAWLPTSGAAAITVYPDAEPSDSKADLSLTDVTFEHDGDTATLGSLEITGVTVGWFAG